MKEFIVLNWWSVMGTIEDTRVLSLANALTGQETDDKTYSKINSGMGYS